MIVPAYNAAATIGEQLEALEQQSYQGPWEAIVADNGSSDATRSITEGFFGRLPGLRIVDASAHRGAAFARNMGVQAAGGEYLAFCDADDVVAEDWLAALAHALETHHFIAGAIDHELLKSGRTSGGRYRSHETSLPLAQRFLPFALSGNSAVTRSAFRHAGGFPEDLGPAGEDIAFSWQMQLAGYQLHFEPRALVAYRHRESTKGLWRQQVAFGIGEVVLFKRFRKFGVPRSRILSVGRAYLRLLWRITWLRTPELRSRWLVILAKRWGRLRGSLRERVLYL